MTRVGADQVRIALVLDDNDVSALVTRAQHCALSRPASAAAPATNRARSLVSDLFHWWEEDESPPIIEILDSHRGSGPLRSGCPAPAWRARARPEGRNITPASSSRAVTRGSETKFRRPRP